MNFIPKYRRTFATSKGNNDVSTTEFSTTNKTTKRGLVKEAFTPKSISPTTYNGKRTQNMRDL